MKRLLVSLRSTFLVTVMLLFFVLNATSSYSQCASAISNFTVIQHSANAVSITWQGLAPNNVYVEWGPCGFTPGTTPWNQNTTTDSVFVSNLDPGIDYDIYLFCGGGGMSSLVRFSFSTSCQYIGNDLMNPQPVDMVGTKMARQYSGVDRWRFSYVSPVCLTNNLPRQPYQDVVFEYVVSPNTIGIDVNSIGAHDSASIQILDTAFNVLYTSDTCSYQGGLVRTGASLQNFPVQFGRTYLITVELDSIPPGDTCGGASPILFYEHRKECVAPDLTNIDTLTTACNAIALYWWQHGVDTFTVSYGLAGVQPGFGTMMTTPDTIVGFSNLLPGTAYDFYFKSACEPSSNPWQGPYTFSTRTGASTAVANFMFTLDSLTITDAYFSFDANASVADSVMWDFGDGNQDVGFLVHHVYQMAGQVTVTALAIHNCSVDTQSVAIYIPYSISEFEAEGFQVYPQPVADFATVQIQADLVLNLNLYDVTGRLITSQLPFENNGENIILDVRNLAPGTYVLQVETANGVSNSRIIRQ